MSTNNDILIWAEQRNGRLMDVSLEILGKAGELAKEIGGKTIKWRSKYILQAA